MVEKWEEVKLLEILGAEPGPLSRTDPPDGGARRHVGRNRPEAHRVDHGEKRSRVSGRSVLMVRPLCRNMAFRREEISLVQPQAGAFTRNAETLELTRSTRHSRPRPTRRR